MSTPSPRHVARIARTLLCRRARWVRDAAPARKLFLGVGAVFVTGLGLAAGVGAYLVLSGGSPGAVQMPGARTAAAYAFVSPLLAAPFRSLQKAGELDAADAYLSALPLAEPAVALLAVETAVFVGFFAPVALAAGVGVAAGTGSLPALVLVPLSVLLLDVAGYAAAYALSTLVLAASDRLGGAVEVAAIGAYSVAYLAVFASGSGFEVITAPLAASPVGWHADLAALGTLPGADPLLAAGALLASLAALAGSCALAVTGSRLLWLD